MRPLCAPTGAVEEGSHLVKSNEHNLRVALIWNGTIYHERTFTKTSEPVVTVGEDEWSVFSVPAEGLPAKFPMFERTAEGYKFCFTDQISGKVQLGEEEFDLDELVGGARAQSAGKIALQTGQATQYELNVGLGDWGFLDLGQVNILFQVLDHTDKVAGRGTAIMDGPLLLTFLFATAVHIAFLTVAEMSYNPDLEMDEQVMMDRFAKFMVDEPKDPIEEEEEQEQPDDDTTGKKAGGEEGKFGDPDEDIPESKIPKVDGEMVDKIDVKNIGVLKALSSEALGAGPLKNIFGNSEGFDAKMNVAMSGEGGELVVGRGAGGMGLRGTGSGGGGEGFGRVGGLGKVDTGGGKGTGGKIGTKSARKVEPRMSAGTPQVGDFCSKDNIRQVVSSRSSAIKYCFEKELQTNPSLSGQIVAQWRIQLDGSVQGASVASSSMSNSSVEGCVLRVIERMRFEKPAGGICVINYPFVFSGVE